MNKFDKIIECMFFLVLKWTFLTMNKYYLSQYQRIFSFIGVGLVDNDENRNARRCNSVVSLCYIALSILLLVQQYFRLAGSQMSQMNSVLDWFVWLSLFMCYALMIFFVNDTGKFLRQNWLMPFILIIGAGLLARHDEVAANLLSYRHLLAVTVFIPALKFLVGYFFDGRLWTTLVAALVIVVFFGLLVVGIDPAINSPTDGIWWALATVTTVGYGDVVPTSILGRMVGAILVIVGLGLFVVITANFLNIMLRNESKKNPYSDVLRSELNDLAKNQKKILEILKGLQTDVEKDSTS